MYMPIHVYVYAGVHIKKRMVHVSSNLIRWVRVGADNEGNQLPS